jgi:hypothetical protein
MEHRGTYWRKIRLCDLRYYILIGFIFSFLRSLGTDGPGGADEHGSCGPLLDRGSDGAGARYPDLRSARRA